LIAIYYIIYAIFVIGIVLAHVFPLPYRLYGIEAIVVGYIEVTLLLALPIAIILYNKKIKKVVDLDYYFKWNVIEMLLIAFPGITTIIAYALLRDRSSLFAFFIVFVALIVAKPTKYKIQKYFSSDDDSSRF